MTALVTAPAGASWAAPVRLDKDAAIDRAVRLGAALLLWLGLLVITYWWVADGGVTDLAHWVERAHLTGPSDWSLGGRSVVDPGAADVAATAAGARFRAGPLGTDPPGSRLALLLSDDQSHHVDHRRLRLRPTGRQCSGPPGSLITAYGGMLLAVGGRVCLIMVVVTSVKAARRRLRYESWHLLHLYAYLGVGLALPHQLWTGQEFLRSPAATLYWWTLWAAAAAAVVVWRIWLPLWRSARYRLRVVGVVRESSDVVSVYLSGHRLDRLPLRAGQFINVRFLSRPGWTRANPFSLSIAPNGHTLRITAKALGEGSARLAHLRPGTRVLFEGPYGRLSSRARAQRKVVLAGAGVGITPLRALAEGLDYAPGEAIILQRYTAEPLFTRELEMLAAERGLEVVHLPGPRRTRDAVLGPAAHGLPELIALRRWIPDLADRDVFLCGPTAWTNGVEGLALAAGVPSERIHTESFGW